MTFEEAIKFIKDNPELVKNMAVPTVTIMALKTIGMAIVDGEINIKMKSK